MCCPCVTLGHLKTVCWRVTPRCQASSAPCMVSRTLVYSRHNLWLAGMLAGLVLSFRCHLQLLRLTHFRGDLTATMLCSRMPCLNSWK
jgi:hypothetical protein